MSMSINELGQFKEFLQGKKLQLDLEHESQINRTLESSAKMIRREEMVSLMPHCIKSLEYKLLMIYLECEICFEGMNQPVEKHKGEVNQEEEAIPILGVLHKNCQLLGPV